jgi:lipopolysaccharide transport system ATP-binding protein
MSFNPPVAGNPKSQIPNPKLQIPQRGELVDGVAIRVEGLGKQYRLGGQRERYTTLRDQLNKLASVPFRALRGREKRLEHDPRFWALKDVSFELKRGEVVGIIGRNGAGKSTLLKILSRITEPTEGEVDVHGRVGSLLEVGTGFHAELTGRENVYLNGAILGMKRSEITRNFYEIVAFAEVEKFIDTPVKHYSSGMYMRLAFSVAAHLEPEILIVDEVLAVGDAEFQKKCLGKMEDVAKGGRTVLFVSHNMGAVQALCSRVIMLDRGRLCSDGLSGRVIAEYLGSGALCHKFERSDEDESPILIRSVELGIGDGPDGPEMTVTTTIRAARQARVSIDIRVLDSIGTPLGFAAVGSFQEDQEIHLGVGHTRVASRHSLRALANGVYFLSVGIADPGVCYHDRAEQCLMFEVQSPPPTGCYRRLEQSWGYGCFELPYLDHASRYPPNGGAHDDADMA